MKCHIFLFFILRFLKRGTTARAPAHSYDVRVIVSIYIKTIHIKNDAYKFAVRRLSTICLSALFFIPTTYICIPVCYITASTSNYNAGSIELR